MKYEVIYPFVDLLDDNHMYQPGDTFPRDGVVVKKERYEELARAKNKIRRPLIVAVDKEPTEPRPKEVPTEEEKDVKKASNAKKRTK